MDITQWVMAHETTIRVVFFVGVFALVALFLWGFRRYTHPEGEGNPSVGQA